MHKTELFFDRSLETKNESFMIIQNAKARQTKEKINEFGWEVLFHPPYSPDIEPSTFHLFRSPHPFLSSKKIEN